MEWRVFVPVVVDDGCENLCKEVIESLVPPENPQEDRSDEYFVTSNDFGLKFRNGEKLELKVRTMYDGHFGIECYSKFKLGKKKLSKQIDNICQILAEHEHVQSQLYAQILSDPKSIVISKSRRCRYDIVNNVAIEVCYIDVEEGKNVDLLGPKKWISVSLESDSSDVIQQYLESTPSGMALTDILRRTIDAACQSGALLPCVSGYPGWIKFLSNYSLENFHPPRVLKS